MQRPRIKPAHNPVWTHDDRIRIGSMQFGIGAEIDASDNDAVWRVFELMDGSRTPAEILAEFTKGRPDIDDESAEALMNALIAAGFAEDAAADPPPTITARDVERYARGTLFYSWVDTEPRRSPWEVQSRLKSSRVTVLGLGGAGSAAATALVASGVGSLHCVDFERVELSNLNRQSIYGEDDLGRGKVESALARLRGLNRDISITGEDLGVADASAIERLLADCDLFLLCADKPEPLEILNWTNEAALRAEKPWILSFYAGPMLVVGLQDPPRTPCYRCLRHAAEVEGRIEGDGLRFLIPDLVINAVVAPSAAMAGNLAALEALYFLGGLKTSTYGRIFHLSLTTYDFQYYVEAEPWPGCPTCGGRAARAEASQVEAATT